MLGAAPLVRRDHVPVAVDLLHRLLEPEEAPRAGVRLVAELHRRALLLREGRGAAVRQQVDEDVVGAEQERVVAGRLERAPALRLGPERHRLDDLDLPRGRRRRSHGVSFSAARLRRTPACSSWSAIRRWSCSMTLRDAVRDRVNRGHVALGPHRAHQLFLELVPELCSAQPDHGIPVDTVHSSRRIHSLVPGAPEGISDSADPVSGELPTGETACKPGCRGQVKRGLGLRKT